MALVNDAKKEIHAKIVYVGPKGSGKGSALRYIYSKLKPEFRSELKVIPAGQHQMLFFDFIYPQGTASNGYTLRFHLYTLIAGDNSQLPWKMLLKGADGIVFLADGAPDRLVDNRNNAALLRDAMAHYGMDLSGPALSVQVNCRELKGQAAFGELMDLFPERGNTGTLVNPATGEGLLEALHPLMKTIMTLLGHDAPIVEEKTLRGEVVAKAAVCEESTATVIENIGTGGQFSVESAGESFCEKGGIVSLPLRLVDSSGEAIALFTLKIAISL